jgi:hypothetical protein
VGDFSSGIMGIFAPALTQPPVCSGLNGQTSSSHFRILAPKDVGKSVGKLQSWLDGGGKSPNEHVLKSRLGEMF